MLNAENVATPPTAATVVVPASVPPPGFALVASVTAAWYAASVLPKGSSAVTTTDGVTLAPAVLLFGCTVKASCVAAAGATSKGLLEAPLRLPAMPAKL